MSIFNLFSRKDINEGVVKYRKEDNAVPLDVRTEEEFSEGHIEGSLNLPIGETDRAATVISDKSVQSTYVAVAKTEAREQPRT